MTNGLSKKAAVVLLGVGLFIGGCSSESDSEGKLQIAASFYPMYEFAKNVAGDLANVTILVPAGIEPHDWEPSPEEMKIIEKSDILIYNGGVEGWVDSVVSSSGNDKLVVVEASKGISLMEGEEHEHEEGEELEGEAHEEEGHEGEEHPMDPHVWLSPVLAQQEVETIKTALITADPDNKETYEKNAAAYIAKLQELDSSFKEELKDVKHKEFVTQHAAFGYLAKAYGLTQVPIAGLSPEQEPSPAEMAEVVKFAKEHDVKTIYFEALVSPKLAETIAAEVGAKVALLSPIEGLSEEDQSDKLDYIGVMRNNLAALKTGLNE